MKTSITKRNKGGDNIQPDMEKKEFQKWLKLSYKRKPGEEKAGYYEYECDFLTREEMYVQWNLHFRQTANPL